MKLGYLVILILSYLLGAIPFGYITVRLKTGQDIRQIQSGRTGGTNAMRAAGGRVGLLTAGLDMLKAASSVGLARVFYPEVYWIHILAPIAAIIGHNLSIFMLRRDDHGQLRLGGGAGGAPCVGGSFGLWPPTFIIIVPLAALIYFGIGYASVTTLSVGLLSSAVFVYRAWAGLSPWTYAVYGLLAELLLILALLPNIRRLIEGNERLVGWRAKRKSSQVETPDSPETP